VFGGRVQGEGIANNVACREITCNNAEGAGSPATACAKLVKLMCRRETMRKNEEEKRG
jgi:hypothetical protein